MAGTQDFIGTFKIKMAAGTAFELLNRTSTMTVSLAPDGSEADYTVNLDSTNSDAVNSSQSGYPAEADSWGNLQIDLGQDENGNSLSCVIAMWIWNEGEADEEKFVFGQVYIGDPDGAGGFGGQGDPTGG